jgi:hypothetical protein
VVIDEELLLEAVRDAHQAAKPADAASVSVALGPIADAGGYWDLATVADDLAELEALGKLEVAPSFQWEGIDPPPKTRIAYVVPSEGS